MQRALDKIGLAGTASVLLWALGACSQPAGEISRDAQPFDGIAEGANVTALGTEPFWGVDIEPDGQGYTARYTTPENLDGTAFAVTRFAGNNGISFSGTFASEEGGDAVLIALTPGDCSDAMSDRSYPYTATVSVGDTTLRGCAFTNDEPFTGEEMP